MKKRHIKSKEPPLDELLVQVGLEGADLDDPQVGRVLDLHAAMTGSIATPAFKPTMSKGVSRAQARTSKGRLPSLDDISVELTALWKAQQKVTNEKDMARNREQIRNLEAQYFVVKAKMPAADRPSGLGYVKRWGGRIYSVCPRGAEFSEAIATLNQIIPHNVQLPQSEMRDRLLAYLWRCRKMATITVGVPLSRGAPKAICSDCGHVHQMSRRYNFANLKLLGCPKCASLRHAPIDPARTRPGSDQTIRLSQMELCRRFHITRSHLRTALRKYLPQQ